MSKRVLIVVDMQNEFINGKLGSREAQEIIPFVRDTIHKGEYNRIYVTLDTHSNQAYMGTCEWKKYPEHCLIYSTSWALEDSISKELASQRTNIVKYCTKSTFSPMEMLAEMMENGDLNYSDTVEIVGVCTDICVISTALALRSQYPYTPIHVLSKGCAGTTPEMHEKALDVMRSCCIEVVE